MYNLNDVFFATAPPTSKRVFDDDSRFLIDKDSFSKLDSRLQNCLFIFACTNSVADPFVYGFFNLRFVNVF